ncbi:MAG: sulfide/dihydroorotate dehydrogenase-like FAD/NAD-binding protein [Limnochordia bacterium]
MFKIVRKEQLAEKITLLEFEAPLVANKALPGQFVILRAHERGERIPLTIADKDPVGGTVTVVVQQVGYSTTLIGSMEVGQHLTDVLGPLGQPADIRKLGRVVCVSGGVGAAIIYPEAKAYKEAGNEVITLMGARNESLFFFTEELEAVSNQVLYATDDGSRGHHGFVTDILRELITTGPPIDRVVAIGPLPMMRATCQLTKEYNIETIVSLNSIMIDGTGMCGGCRVQVGDEIKFCCTDGPEFDGHLVDFDQLMARNNQYVHLERQAGGCQGTCHG